MAVWISGHGYGPHGQTIPSFKCVLYLKPALIICDYFLLLFQVLSNGSLYPQLSCIQSRHLSIHEHMAMGILEKNGVTVPKYRVAKSAQEAFDIANEFGKFNYNMSDYNRLLGIPPRTTHN